MVSKVYFMDARSFSSQTSLIAKMIAVFDAASFAKLVKPGDVVAIKLHCGEWNNTAYLRPVYARTIADKIKSLGGRPFVCDTVTLPYSLYPSRSTGLDLMVTAERNRSIPPHWVAHSLLPMALWAQMTIVSTYRKVICLKRLTSLKPSLLLMF